MTRVPLRSTASVKADSLYMREVNDDEHGAFSSSLLAGEAGWGVTQTPFQRSPHEKASIFCLKMEHTLRQPCASSQSDFKPLHSGFQSEVF